MKRASAHVGRVGGLAVALGIGSAVVTGGAATAWAVPDVSQDSVVSADASSPADPTSSSRADSTPTAERSRWNRRVTPAVPGARDSGLPERKSDPAPQAKAVPSAVAAPNPVAAPHALRAASRLQADRVQLSAVVPAAVTVAVPAAAGGPLADQRMAAPIAVAPTAAAPIMVAAPPTAAVNFDPISLLGSGSGLPVQTPMSWAGLAVTRRQLGESKTFVPPAVTVSTALPTASVAPAATVTNSPPVISTVTLSTPNSTTGAITGTVRASDANGDKLTYRATATTKGAVTITSTGVFVYVPTPIARHAAAKVGATTAVTTDMVTVTVTDAKGATATKAVAVTIAPTNKTPVTRITVGTPNATTGVVAGSVSATDADRDKLTYSTPATTAKGAVSLNAGTGAFTYTPTAAARHGAARIGAAAPAKTDTFTVTVSDGFGGTVPVAVSVAISPKNAVPVAGTTTVGTPDTSSSVVTGKVNATDSDSDALTFSTPVSTTKGRVSLNTATGAFTYTPSEPSRAVPGTDTFTVTITDGYGGSTPVAVSVPIIGKAQQAKLTFVFNYGAGSQYWTSTAKSSLQTAANLVGSYIVVSKPVTLVFDVTAEKSPNSATLASAGSDLTSVSAGFFNTVVQNKILTGVDSNGAAADGSIDVNLGIAWAYGDSVSGSQYDFVSTAMHELLHAFGFLSYVDAPGSSWNSRGTNWTKFDSFIVNNKKTKVIGIVGNRNRWNTAYNSNLTGGSGGLYFGGPNAIAVYGGPVPLYTPGPWEAGSSVTHLNDSTFTGVSTQLMNALADTGKGIRTLSAVELAIFKDLGYTVAPVPATATALLFIGFVFLRRRTL